MLDIVNRGTVFSGGKRHYQLVRNFLPADFSWIDISVPLDEVFKQYENKKEIIVFASGDPLFYGFATTLKREFPESEIVVFPTFNSLQMLAHRLLIPYAEMTNISLTGRSWNQLDITLLENRDLIGVLTDKNKTPSSIASYLLDYGYANYSIYIGEKLGNDDEEVKGMSLEEATKTNFITPNCLILKMLKPRKRFFGIPEKEFTHLQRRENMITKMPIRLISLSMLELFDKQVLWDIGFCTGSVSIEAKLNFPRLIVISFEKREESREILEKNVRKFGVPGINGIIGDFLELELENLPRPDAVFLGGHGGKLPEMIKKIKENLNPGGVIVFNSVSSESSDIFKKSIEQQGLRVLEEHSLTLDQHNPITILKAQ